jgi:hypothetical protein
MTKPLWWVSPCLLALTLATAVSTSAATTIERDFTYGPERFRLHERDGLTEVRVPGAGRDFEAGRPDLPVLGERIELPGRARVTAVEVVSLETALLARKASIGTAVVPKPGLEPLERSAPDPEYYSRSGFQPMSPVQVGYQGWERGRNIAYLRISPVRWNATSGELERIVRVRVKLTLDESLEAPIKRERIVPEWEDASGPRPRAFTIESQGPSRAQPFFATQIPSVLGSPVAYVIITNDAMAPEYERLAEWKTKSGVPAVVRTMSFIEQQYPFGADDAERVRMFIRDAYARWGTKWILLGGDTDIIPTRLARTTFFGGEDIACDMYFSCLDGNWNGDGDHLLGEGMVPPSTPGDAADLLPEVWVGRAPTVTPDDADHFVDRTLQYVTEPARDYENTILFFAEVLFPQNWRPGDYVNLDGATLVEDVLPYVQANPGLHYARLYENYADTAWKAGALQETRQAVLDSLDRGYNMAVHVGHGYRTVMSCADDQIDNDDVLTLSNGNRLSNLYAINCTSNAIDFPCIGEAFLHAPSGGAVTNIGSSRFDFPAAGRYFEEEYFRLVFEDSVTTVGEAQGRQKLPFVAGSTQDGLNRWTTLTLLMLGDPELRQYTGIPRLLDVTHPGTFPLSDTTLTVNVKIGATPLYGALVTVYKPGEDFRTATTNGAGNATLTFRPGTTGTFFVTVTAYDCKPYQGTPSVTAPAVPVLVDQGFTIDDDAIGGTFGDGDGVFNAGETIDLRVPLKNNGTPAPSVTATLSTTDPQVSIITPGATYGPIGAGATANPVAGFRLNAPASVPDQKECAFRLTINDGGGRTSVQTFQLTLAAPVLRHYRHDITDLGGNGDGRPNPGETVNLFVHLQNIGNATGHVVTAKLRNYDGLATVSDSMASWLDMAPADERVGDALVYVPSSSAARLELRVSDQFGLLFAQRIDLSYPLMPIGLAGQGFANSIKLTWNPVSNSDLLGYSVFRSNSPGGPFTRLNAYPTGRMSYYLDEGLPTFSTFYYRVASVDSSGNESAHSAVAQVSTTLPYHGVFPVPMGRSTPSSVAVDHIYPDYALDIVAGSEVLYVWHPDGTVPVDADGAGTTHGDFTQRGSYYAAGPSIADLDGDHVAEIVGPSWDSTRVYVFDQQGNVKPGWPAVLTDPMFSSAAIGDLNNDGSKELVLGSNGNKIYAFRANGTEWMDGDSNPGTTGVFKVLGASFNYGTPAIADINGDGLRDIIYGSFDAKLYAWKGDGSNLPGFPITLPGRITGSVAIGYLDGPADTQLDIVVPAEVPANPTGPDSLYVFLPNGGRHAGFPVPVYARGVTRAPSPALGDINGDGFNDVVIGGTDGGVYVYDRTGASIYSNLRYSIFTGGASESSPIVADINGDGRNDMIMGDENGELTAFNGMTGTVLPGFPLLLEAEVKGTPAVCDCDGDGMTEIVVAGWDKNLYVWDYEFPFSPGQAPPWPQFHHDAMRTGLMTNPAFVSVEDPTPPGSPARLEFAWRGPNPARSLSRVWYSIPAELAGLPLDISVYDLSGRRVRQLASGSARAGRFSAEWDLRDPNGSRTGAGVYFLRLSVGSESRAQKLVVLQ